MLTLLTTWVSSRKDGYLISWAGGMACIVLSLTIIGLAKGRYDLIVQIGPYTALLSGMILIYLGAMQFRSGAVKHGRVLALSIASVLATNIPFILGFTGLGTIVLNLCCAGFMALSGYQYWAARDDSRLTLTINAMLYWLTGATFLACALVLIADGKMVLTAPPNNWAEAANSIAAIVGLTGIGALSLTLHQARATRRHRREALTDPLTGLLNRRALFDRFDNACLPAGRAVLMFDIDHFKQINDRHGHAGGDAVIQHFGVILRQNLVGDGDVVARVGGEEFCAILGSMPLDQAKAVAERIRADFEAAPTLLPPDSIAGTVSIGVATSGPDEVFTEVLRRADDALYRAKHSGRNRVTAAPLRLIA